MRYGLRHTTRGLITGFCVGWRTSMRVLDAALKVIRWLLIWICIPTLIVIVFLSAAWVEHYEKKSACLEKRITALEMRIDWMELDRFIEARLDGIEIRNLADKILDVCVTDTPRPLKKQKGRKQ
jgi:hypothetical protein